MLEVVKDNTNLKRYIEHDIETLTEYYKSASTLKSKRLIKEKLLFLKLKEVALDTKNRHIKSIQPLLIEEDSNIVKKVLIYLSSINVFDSIDSLIDMYIYRALLYEIIGINIGASQEYKKALKIKKSKKIFDLYKSFIERLRELKNIRKKENRNNYINGKLKSFEVKTNIDKKNIPKSAKSLEQIAKYLNNSKRLKNRELAKLYYKESLELYSKLSTQNPKKYKKEYILALIRGVETFNMSSALLEKAKVLINTSTELEDIKEYLLNKINNLIKE